MSPSTALSRRLTAGGIRRIMSLAAALGALGALAAIGHALASRAGDEPTSGTATATLALGFLLLGGWIAGRLAARLGLPALTGQLMAGILAGPSAAQALAPIAQSWGLGAPPTLVSAQDIRYLAGLDALAVAMIGIAAGGELELAGLRRIARQVGSIMLLEMPLVGIAAGAAMAGALSAGLAQLGPDLPFAFACAVAGTLMMASSPAVAIALTREQGGGGAFAQFAMALIVAKDIVLTVAFTGVIVVGARLLGVGAESAGGSHGAGTLAWHLLGSLALGALLAPPLAMVIGRIERRLDMVALVVAALVAAISRTLDLSPLLVALSMGVALRAGAPASSHRFLAATGRILLPVCCVFFAATGAKLDVQSLASALPATVAICMARMAAAWAGATAGARLGGLEPRARRWIWACLVPQAGVAIALASEVAAAFPGAGWSGPLTALLISCAAFNEIVGPPLMRVALRRAQ